jgi:hypothetical protein
MSYFADWDYDTYRPCVLRKDTRIYWGDEHYEQTSGQFVGTFIGENPGGGHASKRNSGWDRLMEGRHHRSIEPGDATLRFVRESWLAAVKQSTRPSPATDDYIEILNCYYFRCPSSGKELANWRSFDGGAVYFQPVHQHARFVVLGWGKSMHNTEECLRLLETVSGQKLIVPSFDGTINVISSVAEISVGFIPLSRQALPSAATDRFF